MRDRSFLEIILCRVDMTSVVKPNFEGKEKGERTRLGTLFLRKECGTDGFIRSR